MAALDDVITQNTTGNSEGFPLGVPSSYSWYSGRNGGGGTPPAGFSAITGWGQIYPEVGQTVNPGSVDIANFETWVHLTSGGWVKVQDQDTSSLGGAHFTADFVGNANIAWNQTTNADGSVSVDAPTSGYNDHFWPGGSRGTYTPGTIDGVFVTASMKVDNPNEHYVANIGADWWRDATAGYVYQNGVFVNNPGVGMSNWVDLTTSYKQLYFTTMNATQLQGDLPPPLQGASSPATPTQPTTPTTPTTPTDPTIPAQPTTPTDPTTPTTPTTPSVTAPVLDVADKSLWVAGRGGQVDLGTTITTTDPNDNLTLSIMGLPRYETITTGDGTTLRGNNITLTSAQVDSGLTLTSYYKGNAHPVANLTLTASAMDPTTGAVMSSDPQTIRVTDPRPSSWTGGNAGSWANHGFAQLQQQMGDTSTLANTASQTTGWADQGARASQASQGFALLNQYLAGSSGRVDAGQIAAAMSNANSWTHNSFLSKPQG
ncbi:MULTISPECIES: hypothetical protein [Bradyrhizobium]|uniref:Uncharacterized protein n=1 Tax=Bradyrhizobium brasilense TaxID=1419277 RepID=A0ABY8JJH2_9BRAD|nr:MULTISPECIES: hypothetical protein [Bradyrhizobium]MCP1829397.1 hypothetical protein [Bradyrhizobium sp. USDA 4545]MCP1922505.1 hypothetical protein [Bradyrhizobium sp. USDA 4532]WFU64516.1 hypothetical protein QA636_02850 [Bradyrhizobium brasilense]